MKEENIKEVEGTPFALVQTDDGNYMAVMGHYALTKERFDDEESFKTWLDNNQWTIVAVVASIIADQFNKPKEKEE